MKCVVPVSGGIDSTVLLYWAVSEGKQVHAVSFNYGQKHLDKEMACAKRNCTKLNVPHKVIDLSFFKDVAPTSALTNDDIDVAKARDVLGDPQTVNYVPNRNMMLLSICTAYAEAIQAESVYHGAALIDSQAGFWDGSAEFIQLINKVNKLNRKCQIEILAPLITKSKEDIILKGIDVGVDFRDTWTCYEGGTKACGECTACSSRIQGFLSAGYKDPIEYSRQDIPWEGCKEI